jgi:hypothetical protein
MADSGWMPMGLLRERELRENRDIVDFADSCGQEWVGSGYFAYEINVES